MAQELVVRIVGDASSLEKTFRQASGASRRFGKDMDRTFRGTIAGSGAFRGLGRSIAFASAGFLGGFGLTAAIRGTFDEMSKAQQAAAQTAAAIKSTGGVAGVTAEHVDELATSLLNLSGVDDEAIKGAENLLLTFTNVRNVVGKNNDIFDQATKAALDLSVRFGKDLPSAAILVGKALQDPVKGLTSLSRTGVQFSKAQRELIKNLIETGHTMEAQKVILAELRRETGGAAAAAGDTLSGKLSLLRETVKNVAASILEQYLPAITKVIDRALAWVTNLENQKRVMNDVKQVAGAVADVFNVLRGAFEGLNKITGSTKNTIKLLIGALIVLKGLKLAGALAGIASNVGLIGTNARTSTGQVAGLRGQLGKLGAIGVITVTVELVLTHKKQIEGFFDKHHLGFLNQPGLAEILKKDFESRKGETGSPEWLLNRLAGRFKKEGDLTGASIKETGKKVAKALREAALLAATKPPGDVRDPGLTKAQRQAAAARVRQSHEAARQAAVDRAVFATERAAATKTLTDDLASLGKLQALLKRRIAGGHSTLALERQLFDVQQQIAGVVEQQAEARKAARDARQFKILGFGPTGEDLVPGVKNLKRQLASVTDAIEGTFLDTAKTRNRLNNIRRVLAAGVGHISNDVRSKIQQMIADLKAQLRKTGVDVSRFQKTARGQFVLAGAHGAGSGTVVIGNVHLHGIQNLAQLEAALAKRKKQRAHARGGTR